MRCEGARGRRAETAGQVVGSRSHIKLIRPHWSDGTEVHCGKERLSRKSHSAASAVMQEWRNQNNNKAGEEGGRGGGVIVEFH